MNSEPFGFRQRRHGCLVGRVNAEYKDLAIDGIVRYQKNPEFSGDISICLWVQTWALAYPTPPQLKVFDAKEGATNSDASEFCLRAS